MWEWFIHLPRCHNLGRHEYTAWKQYVICLPTTHGGLHSLPGFHPSPPQKKVSFWHSSLVSSLVGLLAIAWPVQATSCENHCARIVPTWWPKMGCSSQSGRKYGIFKTIKGLCSLAFLHVSSIGWWGWLPWPTRPGSLDASTLGSNANWRRRQVASKNPPAPTVPRRFCVRTHDPEAIAIGFSSRVETARVIAHILKTMCFWCGLGWDGPITFMCLRYPAVTHVTLQHALALSNRQRVQCNQEPPAAAQHGRSVAALTLSYVVPCQCVSSPRIAIRIAGEWQHHYALLRAHTLHCIKLHYITLRYITSHHITYHYLALH